MTAEQNQSLAHKVLDIQVTARRPDASMTLLREVMERPLDPAYALAASRRVLSPSPTGRRVGAITMVIALVCGWIAVRSVEELRRPEPGAVAGRIGVEREISRRSGHVEAQQKAITALRAQIAKAQAAAMNAVGQKELADQAQRLAVASGELPVTGQGLVVSLNDASAQRNGAATDPRQPDATDQGRVLDRDVQIVINGLWVAGAEAISINGERLTGLSAIRSAGQAILVDFRPLSPPYVIQAIGDPSGMQSRFAADMAGPYLQSLRDNYGIEAGISASSALTLPGAGALSLRSASPPVAGSPSTQRRASTSSEVKP